MPTQRRRYPPRASDLFAFKAHFRDGKLPPGLMPLLIFPGRIRRYGANRRRPREPVMLHSPRRARTLQAQVGNRG